LSGQSVDVIFIIVQVLVTGANGFIGSWICRVLTKKHQVVALVRTASDIYRLRDLKSIKVIRGGESAFHDAVKFYSPQVVVMSDWWGVENQFRDSEQQFSNVARLKSRLPVLKEVDKLIGIGSQAELGPKSNWITEEETDAPTTLYGAAKVDARKILQTNLSSRVQFIWSRIFSTYGPLDAETWLIPSTIHKILNGERVALTRGEQDWSFLHSWDLGCAFETMVEDNNIDGIVNVGNEETVKIAEVVKFIGDYMGKSDLLDFGSLPYRPDQVMRLAPVTRKLSNAGWLPRVGIRDGLENMVQWMSGNSSSPLKLSNGKALKLNLPSYGLRK